MQIKRFRYVFQFLIKDIKGKYKAKKRILNRPIWLVSERGNDARDNGYWFFKYLCEKHPEIDPIYCISEDSADYEKIRAIGRTVSPGSEEHYELMYAADALISSHDCGYTPDMVTYHYMNKYHLFNPKGKQVFLQHGIVDKDIEWLHYDNFKPDMFVVSADSEYQTVKELFHQPDEVIKQTGLARYDSLKREKSEEIKIVMMPTWRAWLQDTRREEFIVSDFFQKYQTILTSYGVQDILNRYNAQLIFYPHIEAQKYIAEFKNNSPNIRVASFKTDDVQTLLKQADLLITDYSSVFFDVAYMNTPVMFYQFDKDRFMGEHYIKCLTDYDKFGQVVNNKPDFKYYLERFLLGDKFGDQEYIDNFYRYRDSNNCDRIFNEIQGIVKHGKQ